MNPTVEETFFGAFLDKNPDILEGVTKKSFDDGTRRQNVEAFTDNTELHIAPELVTDRNEIVIGHSAATPFDDHKPSVVDLPSSDRLALPKYGHQLARVEKKLDLVLQILTTPKKRGRPVGTTGIKKSKTKKVKATAKVVKKTKKTFVKKKLARK